MTWFKVDDTLAFHAKVVAAGNAAMGLWVRSGSWCAQQLNDGRIPENIALTLGTRAEINRLVTAHLWIAKDDGYEFWQWGDDGRQPSRAQVEADRHATRERQRRARERAKSQRDTHRDDDVTNTVTNEGVTP
jgi:hypothetical protein